MANKHDRECLANWAKENRVNDWEKIYEANHPSEVNKRRQNALKWWNQSKQRKENKRKYK